MKERLLTYLNPAKLIGTVAGAGRVSHLLLVALGVQLLLATVLFWQSTRTGQFAAAEKLFAINKDDIEELRIFDAESEINIVKDGDVWRVKGEPELPADDARVTTALDSLTNLSAGLPVANNESSQAQLEVAKDNFQRRVVVKAQSGEETELFIGTSPGFRKAHLRKADDSAIYAANINAFDLPAQRNDWFDKAVLAMSDVTEVTGDGFKLALEGEQWTLLKPLDLPSGKVLNSEKVVELVSALETLRVNEIASALPDANTAVESSEDASAASTVADADIQSDETESEAPTRIEVTLDIVSQQQELTLTLHALGDEAVAQRADIDQSFAIDASLVETLSTVNLDSLLMDAEENAEPLEVGNANE